MKVELNKDGVLFVMGETVLETYALNQWRRNFNRGDYESVLMVNAEETAKPEE